jgi:UDP:flavonoid glycosyltransferase YjiC (YdhE family)
MRVAVSAQRAALRRRLVEIDRRRVEAVEFVSLPDLLTSCQVVISHAGAGTVLASLAAGVPLVLVPRGSPSQMRMAHCCQTAGVGRWCDAAGLIPTLDEVLDDPSIRAAARATAVEIAAMPDASEVVPKIVKLVHH